MLQGQRDFCLGNRMISNCLKDSVLFLILSLHSQSLVLFLWQVVRYPTLPLRRKRKNLLQYTYTHACMPSFEKLANTLQGLERNSATAKHEKILKETYDFLSQKSLAEKYISRIVLPQHSSSDNTQVSEESWHEPAWMG